MKKALFFAGLAAASLAFVGCNKEADLAGNGVRPCEIILNTVDTRTVNAGMATNWAENDALSVFVAPAGTTNWTANTKFTVSDTESGLAQGEIELPGKTNDWYLLYPYTGQVPNPTSLKEDGTPTGYIYVGSSGNGSQKQTGLNSTAHLAGIDLPMYGIKKGVSFTERPAIPMKHMTSVAKVNVKNATSDPVTITAVSFTAPESIVGTYFIDFSGEAPVFTESGATYVNKTARLEVKNAEALAPGETASFYIAIKPFTAAAGSALEVQVYAGAEVSTSEMTLSAAANFQAGHIKTLNVEYAPASVEGLSIAEALALEDGADVALAPLTVGAVATRGYVVTDGTDGLYVYVNSTPSVKVGDKVKVVGKMASYYGVRQISGPSQTVETEGDGTFEANWTDITSTFEEYTNTSSAPVKYKATVVKNGTYTNFKVEGADTYVGTLTNAPSAMFADINEGDEVEVYGYFSTINKTNNLVGVYAYKLEVLSSGAPVFDATLVGEDHVPAATTSVKVNVTGNVEWRAEPEDGMEGLTLSPTSGTGAGEVTATFPANTTASEKTYIFYIRTDDPTLQAQDKDEKPFTIVQAAFDSSNLSMSWDLSTDSYEKPTSETKVVWSDAAAQMVAEKGTSTTNTNNYLGGDANNRTSSRFYTGSTLTITPANGVTIKSVEFTATSDGYATALKNSTWTNGTPEIGENTKLVTVTPADGTKAISAGIGGTVGLTLVVVNYSGTPGGFPSKTLESITLSGQKTEWTVGDTYKLDGTVTAHYSDGSTSDVTSAAEVTTPPDMTQAGEQEVTVKYTEGEVSKTAKYTITVSAAAEAITVTQACALADNAEPNVADAIVAALCTKGFIATDGTSNIYVYENKQPTVSLGDKVNFSAVKTTYFGLPELKTVTNLKVVSQGNAVPRTSLVDITSTIDTYSSSDTDYLTVTGKLEKSGSYYNVTITGAERYATPMYLYGIDPSALVGQSVKMTGYFNTINTNKKCVQFIATEIVAADPSAKFCTVDPEVLNVAADATSATLSIQANAAWTVASDNSAFTVSPASGTGDATVTISFAANTTATPKVANITVSCPDASVNKVVVLTQSGKVTGTTDVLDLAFTGVSGTNYTEFSGKEGTSGAVYAGQCAGGNDSIQLRSKNNNSGIVTTATGGKVKKVTVTWNTNTMDGRTLQIYGSNTAYTAATDLYDDAKKGTLLGTIAKGTSTEITITGDYQFLGLRSAADAMYISEIQVIWQ